MLSSPHSQDTGVTFLNGRYRLGEGRWEGAVGVVREAFDTLSNDRRVVIKHPDPYQGPEVRAHKEQLLDVEAKALSLLRGLPHVCAVLDQGRVGRGPGSFRYLVIEWAHGEPVANMVQQASAEGESVPIGTVLLILIQLARVLSEAHRKGIINNDVDIKHLYWSDAERNLIVIDWGNAKTESGSDWGRFGYHDDLVQFADVMFCLLTGQASLDVKRADLAFWQNTLADTLEVVREDLALIGSRASAPDGGYRNGGELYDDLNRCLGRLRTHLDGHLREVDALLAEASADTIAEAEHELRGLCDIAPLAAAVVQRVEALHRIRRDRQESAALQLGCAYVKAESWLDAIEVLSRTFGHNIRPDCAAALLLAAAKLIDFRGATTSAGVTRWWATGAKAIAERRYEEALEAYLSVPDEWLETRAEPVRSLLSITGRYILRHEVRRVGEALRNAWRAEGDPEGNSHRAPDRQRRARLGTLYRQVAQALTVLTSCAGGDWMAQRHGYAGIARALEACRGSDRDLPQELIQDAEDVALVARELVGHMEDAERALDRLDPAAAAVAIERLPRLDPDHPSALQHAEAIRALTPVFEHIGSYDGWGPDAWSELEEGALGAVEDAFASLPGSSLKPLVARLVRTSVTDMSARRDAERVEQGLRLLEERKWHATRQWAGRLNKAHPDWVPAGYVAGLAEAYLALYDLRGDARDALDRAASALQSLDGLQYRHEELTRHKKRLEAIVECCQHLFGLERGREQALALAALENLPGCDPHRQEVLDGVALMGEIRAAADEGQWDVAAGAAKRLRAVRIAILSNAAGRWDRLFAQVAEAQALWEAGRPEDALGRLDRAGTWIGTAGSGGSLVSAREVEAHIARMKQEWADQPTADEPVGEAFTEVPAPPEEPAPPPMRHSSDLARSASRAGEVARAIWSDVATLTHTLADRRREAGHKLADELASHYSAAVRRLRSKRSERASAAKRKKQPPRAHHQGSATPSAWHRSDDAASAKTASPGGRATRLTKEPLEALGWTLGGAAVVGIIAVVLILLAAQEAAGRGVSDVMGGSTVEQGVAEVERLLRDGQTDVAALRLQELQAQYAASPTAEQLADLQALEDCLWLSKRPEEVVPALINEDLRRLDRLWARAQADGGRGVAELCRPDDSAGAVIESAVRNRWAHLQALTGQRTPEAYQAVADALAGLEDADISALCGDVAAFRDALVTAHAALARYWLGVAACDQGRAALERVVALTQGDQREVVLQDLTRLTALEDTCEDLGACCEAAARLAQTTAPHSPGDDLMILADLRDRCAGLEQACPEPGLAALVGGRLDALQQMVAEEEFAEVVEQGLALAGDPWFTGRPLVGRPSVAEIVADAYAGWIRQVCVVEDCGAGHGQLVAQAESFMAEYGGSLSADRRAQVVSLLEVAHAGCPSDAASTQTTGASPASEATVSVSLLDDTPGAWSDHGIYYGDTADSRSWHLNDVYIKRRAAPIVYRNDTLALSYGLYTTDYRATDVAMARVVSLRMSGKLVSAKGAVQGARPLWGAQVPGSGSEPTYVLAAWEPSADSGRWSLRIWSPTDGESLVVQLPDGPADLVTELRIVGEPGGSVYNVYWQGELVLAGRPLPAPADGARVRLVVGEGVHVWIQDAEAQSVPDAGASSPGEKAG